MHPKVKLIECEQRSEEWRHARKGIVTASEMSKVLAQGKGGARASNGAGISTGSPPSA